MLNKINVLFDFSYCKGNKKIAYRQIFCVKKI